MFLNCFGVGKPIGKGWWCWFDRKSFSNFNFIFFPLEPSAVHKPKNKKIPNEPA